MKPFVRKMHINTYCAEKQAAKQHTCCVLKKVYIPMEKSGKGLSLVLIVFKVAK